MKDEAKAAEALRQAKRHILEAQNYLSVGMGRGVTGTRVMYELLRLSDSLDDAVDFTRNTTST